jgi:hypothetical protein
MKQGMECLLGLHYKLCMMGVAVLGPSYIYGDNMSVIHNTQRPESMLKKKSNSLCYHAIREAVAMGECLTGHVSTHDNPADICTKVIPGGRKRQTRSSGWSTPLRFGRLHLIPPHRGSWVSWVPLVLRCEFLPKCQCMPYALFDDRRQPRVPILPT